MSCSLQQKHTNCMFSAWTLDTHHLYTHTHTHTHHTHTHTHTQALFLFHNYSRPHTHKYTLSLSLSLSTHLALSLPLSPRSTAVSYLRLSPFCLFFLLFYYLSFLFLSCSLSFILFFLSSLSSSG